MTQASYAGVVPVPDSYIAMGGLKIHPVLADTVERVVCKDTGFSPAYFWSSLEKVVNELHPELESCLAKRDELQAKIDGFYCSQKKDGADLADPRYRPQCQKFLREIGYLEPDKGPVSVNTQFVDPEIAEVAAPQLVVPSDNARYVLNAVNARWVSLFDAFYGFDVIGQTALNAGTGGGAAFALVDPGPEAEAATAKAAASQTGGGYSPERGQQVVDFAMRLLDRGIPLASGKWSEVVRLWPNFVGKKQQLKLLLKSGETTSLATPSIFIGSSGSFGPPTKNTAGVQANQHGSPQIADKGQVFLKHNGLHFILEIDFENSVGRGAPGGIKDIVTEAALSVILDMEDSVAAVDAEDKSRIYTNICGVLRGTLEEAMVKNGQSVRRTMRKDLWIRDEKGQAKTLPGRALCLVRNVGHHMFTDMVLTAEGRRLPEGFIDCFVTIAGAFHDLDGTGMLYNSRAGSVYIVKPKMHGPREVALTSALFGRAEEFFGLRRNTIKMGIMDEERRTSANLRECLRQAAERVFFINTGFLDRTGDEIHTCLLAGPVVRKADMKAQPWIKAYEDSNVDVGIFAGLPGQGQIGKGMWAKPDHMRAMLDAKIAEPMAGASCAWVPSPAAAGLHSLHYHLVDVPARQMQLSMRPHTKVETILEPPLLQKKLEKEQIIEELRENAQSILGYVVRWVDLGVGCSKVPDLKNVGLMEDRATLRISSQLLANWLQHGLTNEAEVRQIFAEMALTVDQQNKHEKNYSPMSANLDTNIAFQAALKLVLGGRDAPNGYTEFTLHEARGKVKATTRATSRL